VHLTKKNVDLQYLVRNGAKSMRKESLFEFGENNTLENRWLSRVMSAGRWKGGCFRK